MVTGKLVPGSSADKPSPRETLTHWIRTFSGPSDGLPKEMIVRIFWGGSGRGFGLNLHCILGLWSDDVM